MKLKTWVFVAISGATITSCEGPATRQDVPASAPAMVVQEKVLFTGSFSGNANDTQYRLDILRENDGVRGTMKGEEGNFLIEGIVSGERLKGSMKSNLWEIPFEAYYQGPSLVVQLDKETMDGLKSLAALATEDGNALLLDDKIVFDER